MLGAALVLARKDIKLFIRDRGALMLSVLVPIALVSVFGWIMAYAFGGSGGMPKVTLHVCDLDRTSTSQSLIEQLRQVDMLRVTIVEIEESQNAASRLEGLIREGDAHHVLILSEGFESEITKGAEPPFAMLRDPGRSMEDQIVQISIVQASMAEFGSQLMINSMDRILVDQGMGAGQVALIRNWMTSIGSTIEDFSKDSAANERAANEKTPSEKTPSDSTTDSDSALGGAKTSNSTTSESQGNNDIDAQAVLEFMTNVVPIATTDISPPSRDRQVTYQQAQSVAGMSVMMLLFALTSCGGVLLKEREDGTLKRLFAQPIPRGTILLGKFLFVFVIGFAQLSILFVYGEWMFRVGLFRDPLTLVILSATWVAAGGAFGMFLASISRTSKQAEGLASLLILLMAALGGCWFPLQMMNLPPLLDGICKSTMTYWAMTGYQGMLWNQLSWTSPKMLTALGWQWAWVIALTALSVYFYRRNYCRG